MPTASRQVRKLRRIRRERSLAFRLVNASLQQRDDARMIASGLEQELKKYIDKFGEIKIEKVPSINKLADQLNGESDAKV